MATKLRQYIVRIGITRKGSEYQIITFGSQDNARAIACDTAAAIAATVRT